MFDEIEFLTEIRFATLQRELFRGMTTKQLGVLSIRLSDPAFLKDAVVRELVHRLLNTPTSGSSTTGGTAASSHPEGTPSPRTTGDTTR